MKKIILVLALLCCAVTLFAKPPKGWTDDYEAALKTAAKEGKHVYVLFTGSDWCHWCIKLHKEVLSKKEFQDFAKKHFVLVYCDFPRKNGPSGKQLEKQKQWNYQLKAGGGVPSAVIVDSNGKIAGKINGFAELKNYMKKLESFVK